MTIARIFCVLACFLVLVMITSYASEVLEDGNYKIRYEGPGPCNGKYLVYQRFGKDLPARISLGSASTDKSPVLWTVRTVAHESSLRGQFTLTTTNRAAGFTQPMTYRPRSCNSPTVTIDDQGIRRWRLQPVDVCQSLFRINAVERGPSACGSGRGVGRLGPSTLSGSVCAGVASKDGVRMWPLNSATQNMTFRFVIIGAPLRPPLP